MYNKVLTYLLT